MSTSSLDQLELQLEELEASADPQAAEQKFSAPWRRKPGSQLTRRWSKGDSNSPSHPERQRSEARHMGPPPLPVSESRPPEKRHVLRGSPPRRRQAFTVKRASGGL